MICLRFVTPAGTRLGAVDRADSGLVPRAGDTISAPGLAPLRVLGVHWIFTSDHMPAIDLIVSPIPPSTLGYGDTPHDPV